MSNKHIKSKLSRSKFFPDFSDGSWYQVPLHSKSCTYCLAPLIFTEGIGGPQMVSAGCRNDELKNQAHQAFQNLTEGYMLISTKSVYLSYNA